MELSPLQPLLEAGGPYVTLHLEVGRPDQGGVEEVEARWTRVRHDLERHGVDAALIEKIGERVQANTHLPGEVRRTLVANGEDILLDAVQAGHSVYPEVIDHGDLPDLAGWLAMEDEAVPFVLVVADRTGADLELHRASGGPATEHDEVTGETFYITKVAEGDWSQKEFQQTAEDAWRDNARQVADHVRSMVMKHRPAAVLVAGEVRARAEVVKAFEHESIGEVDVIQVEAGGRAAGASTEAMWAEIRQRLAAVARAADADVSNKLDEARGRAEGAATGLDEVLTALAQAQVERLVLDLAALEDKEVEPGAHPGLALPTPASGADRLPADRALVAAGALTGAELTLLPAAMGRGGGVSALLRWTDQPSANA